MRTILSLLIVGLVATVAECREREISDGAGVSVVATTTQVADLARNAAGGRAAVTQVLSPNSDPHEYEPRPSDAEAIADADVIIRSGGDVDEWVDEIIDASGTDAEVTSLIDSVETIEGPDGDVDPHWWQDPRDAELAVAAIRDRLIATDPDGVAIYTASAADYLHEIEDVDGEIEACISSVPADRRKLVTSHDALGYYANRYGIEVIGAAIPALSTQAQASAGEAADLTDLIRTEGVATVFPEAGVSRQLEEAIADDAGAEVGGQLWADSLGPADSDGATYLDALASNTRVVVEGLTGGRATCSIETAHNPDSSPAR